MNDPFARLPVVPSFTVTNHTGTQRLRWPDGHARPAAEEHRSPLRVVQDLVDGRDDDLG